MGTREREAWRLPYTVPEDTLDWEPWPTSFSEVGRGAMSSSSWCHRGLAGLLLSAVVLIVVELGDWVVFWSKEQIWERRMLSVNFK